MEFHGVCSRKPNRTEWGSLEAIATLNTQACLFQSYKTIVVQVWIDNVSSS